MVQENIVNLFRWYQSEARRLDEKVVIPKDLLKYHRLDTIYYSYCLDNGMQEYVSKEQRQKQVEIAEKYAIYRDVAMDLSTRLKREKIPHVFLKGFALTDEIYAEPWHRYFSDLDLLVDKEHISTVERVLNNMGYQYGYYSSHRKKIYYPTKTEILFQRIYTHELYKMFRMETESFASEIDVNFLFMWRGTESNNKTYSVLDLIDHVVQRQGIPTFDNVANMVHLCCHLYNEATFFALDKGYDGGDPREILLIRVFDIALLAQRLSRKEYNSLVMLAKQMGCIDKVAYALGVVNLLLKLDIGHDVQALSIESEETYSGYYGMDQQYHTWPISIYDRVFDLQKKREVSDMLFPKLM